MKRNFFIVAVILALMIVGIASGASSDQGRRLAGPFCVGKATLQPFFVKNVGWVSRAGAVRSISINETCQSTELRKLGVAVADIDTNSPAAPGVAGAQGEKGDAGAPGKNGTDGKDGSNGENGAPGQTGEAGATGPQGPAGPAGSDNALGYVWICADGNSGHGLAFGGTGAQPDCNGGTKFAYYVEFSQVKAYRNLD